jgi:hypothetical protein
VAVLVPPCVRAAAADVSFRAYSAVVMREPTGLMGVPWEQMFTASSTAMWISQGSPDGAVVAVNTALCRLTDRTAAQVMQAGLVGVFQSASGGEPDMGDSSGSIHRGQVSLPDGSVRWLTATSTPATA